MYMYMYVLIPSVEIFHVLTVCVCMHIHVHVHVLVLNYALLCCTRHYSVHYFIVHSTPMAVFCCQQCFFSSVHTTTCTCTCMYIYMYTVHLCKHAAHNIIFYSICGCLVWLCTCNAHGELVSVWLGTSPYMYVHVYYSV